MDQKPVLCGKVPVCSIYSVLILAQQPLHHDRSLCEDLMGAFLYACYPELRCPNVSLLRAMAITKYYGWVTQLD